MNNAVHQQKEMRVLILVACLVTISYYPSVYVYNMSNHLFALIKCFVFGHWLLPKILAFAAGTSIIHLEGGIPFQVGIISPTYGKLASSHKSLKIRVDFISRVKIDMDEYPIEQVFQGFR